MEELTGGLIVDIGPNPETLSDDIITRLNNLKGANQ